MKFTAILQLARQCGLVALAATATTMCFAQELQPGKGVAVQPIKTSIPEEIFQTRIVMRALQDLGYDVAPAKEIEPATAYLVIASGDATFTAGYWDPLQTDFYKNAGGSAKLSREGVFSTNALQGYLIDRKTAEKYHITNIGQLADPKLAKLFDADGDGKADLAGCTPGWGCEPVIENHLRAYKLSATVDHRQGSYAALIADVIARQRAGKPVLYYAWVPYWVSAVLVPGKDVVWLEVPFSSQPGANAGMSTKLPNDKDYGFQVNKQQIVANQAFVQAHPDARMLFAKMQVNVDDINAQNLRMNQGEKSSEDIDRHVTAWIHANQKAYDGWLNDARAAASK